MSPNRNRPHYVKFPHKKTVQVHSICCFKICSGAVYCSLSLTRRFFICFLNCLYSLWSQSLRDAWTGAFVNTFSDEFFFGCYELTANHNNENFQAQLSFYLMMILLWRYTKHCPWVIIISRYVWIQEEAKHYMLFDSVFWLDITK